MERLVVVTAVSGLLFSACGGAEAEPAVSAAPEPIEVVAIGDSLVPTGWVEQYAAQLAESLDVQVTSHVVTAMEIPDAVQVVKSPGPDQDLIADAEVVIVEVGYNNAIPFPQTGIGCGGSLRDDSPEAYAAWTRTTTPDCLAEGVATYGALYDEVLAGVKELRGDEPTVLVTMGTPNADLAPVEDFPDWMLAGWRKNPQEGQAWFVAGYDRWNAMIEERSAAAGYQHVDVYHAFNGADGSQSYYPELTDDGVHPNQAGNDVIVGELGEVDTSAISDR